MLIALALRLGSLWQLADSPLIEIPVGTSSAYAQVLETGVGAEALAAPLYALLLTLSQDLIDPWGVRLVQAFLGAINCALIALLGLAVAGRAGGWWAGMLGAAYGPALLYGAELVPAILASFLALAALSLLIVADRRDDPVLFAVGGLVTGAAALAEARLLLLVPAVLIWAGGWRREQVLRMLAFALPALTLIWVGGSWRSLELPAPQVALERLYLAWHGVEILPDLDAYGPGFDSGLIAALTWEHGLAFPFGLVAPLALAGAALRAGGKCARADALLGFFAAAATVGAAATATGARGRLPLALALLPWAAVALTEGRRRLAARPVPVLAAVALVGMVLAAEPGLARARGQASHQRWLGYAYEHLDMQGSAIGAYEAALAGGIAEPAAYRALARIYAEAGALDRSVGVYRQLVERWPGDSRVRVDLADHLLGAGRALEAEKAYRAALASGADSAVVLGRLGDALQSRGDHAAATDAYQRHLQTRPDSHRVRFRLARVLEENERGEEAVLHYRRLIELPAWETRTSWRLAKLLVLEAERRLEAEELLRRTLVRHPDLQPALWTLSALLHDEGRQQEALVPLERLRAMNLEDYQVYRLLASVFDRLGRSEEAEEAFSKYQQMARQATIHRRVQGQLMELQTDAMAR
jgi:tetratricopeptide (TPR) repeat protein